MAALDTGALTQEVANLKEGHAELRKEFRVLDGKMDSGFALLSQKLDAKTTPQWQPITIAVTVMLAIGGIFITTIKEALTKNETAIETVRRENEMRVVKLWDQHNKVERDLSYLQGQLHPLPKP
jgi:hypothetical protein